MFGRFHVVMMTGLVALAISGPVSAAGVLSDSQWSACTQLAAAAMPGGNKRQITDFGVKPDAGGDQGPAIQKALDSLKSGDVLVFAPGRYEHGKQLDIKVPGVTLWGYGAQLHGTNPADQALMVMANSVGVYGFGISGTTDKRLTTPWSGGISAWLPGKTDSLSDITIRDNKIAPLGGSDAEANSTSSAGIFVSRVSNFLVAGNTVQRTLADGIHITAGSSNGRVVRNTVRESGDDMIAVVSYLPVDKNDPDLKQVAANLPTLIQQNLDHDILIEGNDVSGQYWGRGITVVGGKDVTIRNNSISNTSTGAAVYLAREASYSTFGVTNVVVEDNTISHVQTVAPTYTPPNWSANDHRKGGHAAIFVLAQTYDFEEADPGISNALKVAMIRIENNKIDDTAADGIRIGTSTDLPGMRVPRNLNVEAKRFAGRPIGSVAIIQNQLTNVRGTPMQLKTSGNQQGLFCDKNSAGAGPSDSGGCGSAPIKVTGAPQSCQTQH